MRALLSRLKGEESGRRTGEQADFVEGILQNLDDFDYEDLTERSRAQATVYLMQAFGIETGFSFTWPLRAVYSRESRLVYLQGVYSTDMYDSIEVIRERGEGSPLRRFTDPSVADRFEEFSEYIQPRISDIERLQVASVLHYTHERNPETSPDRVIEWVMDARDGQYRRDRQELYEGEWEALAEYGVVEPDTAIF